MTFVTVDAQPIGELSVAAQAEMMHHERERIDRELPLNAILQERRQSMQLTGSPYNTVYDRLMWDIVGNPYNEFDDKEYGHHLFSGLSDEGEILSVTTTLDGSQPQVISGYQVHTLHVAKMEGKAWTVKGMELSGPSCPQDVRLWVGKSALSGNGCESELTVAFRSPSRSDASVIEGECRTFYNRLRLKNLYSVVHAFDAKYRILECLYAPESEVATVLPLVTEPAVQLSHKTDYVTAA
jgi:hypothetical protein